MMLDVDQNNKIVKIDGGAIGIPDSHTTLLKWEKVVLKRSEERVLISVSIEFSEILEVYATC